MVTLAYIDETGSVGKGAAKQPLLTLAVALVDENEVTPLRDAFRQVAWDHLGWVPSDFELHGNEIWNGTGHWQEKSYAEQLAVYEQAIAVLDDLNVSVSWASIDKAKLSARYDGAADDNAYLLALQFLLEKVDAAHRDNKILVADEAKEHQLRAIKMVSDMQIWGGGGAVPGQELKTVIDSMHFVSSHASPGVQLADLIAYALQRQWNRWDSHPDARAALARICGKIDDHASTWREPWPR